MRLAPSINKVATASNVARLIALLFLSSAFGVFGEDASKPVSYTRGPDLDPVHGRIISITDGDTVKALTAANEQIRVRLAFIDAPEKGQAFGQRAKQAMSELVFGKDVKLLPQTIDRYGRLIAQVFVEGQDAGLEMLKQGLCWVYEKYISEASAEIQTSYRAAQSAAQSDRLGLWQDPDPVPPWQWRKSEKEHTRMVQEVS